MGLLRVGIEFTDENLTRLAARGMASHHATLLEMARAVRGAADDEAAARLLARMIAAAVVGAESVDG